MAKITYVEHDGTEHTVEVKNGTSVMEGAIKNNVPGIDADCGGACACATCHVYVAEEWTAKVGKPQPMEDDMLDFAFDVRPVKGGTAAPGETLLAADLVAWDAGSLEVPAMEVSATDADGKTLTAKIPAASVTLTSLLGDDMPLTELASGIRGPVDIGGRPWWWWAIAAAAVVVGGVAVWKLLSRRAPDAPEPELPAGEWAMLELARLEQERLPERGEVEGFFVRLSDVVRAYVERRFAIAAPDRTTQEFLREAAHHPDLAGEHERTIGAFLRSADMVKFAAARPGTDTCDNALAAMRGFVERTAPKPEAAEPPVHVDAGNAANQEVRP
jgi:2Fe-2S ferredoxin